MGGSRDNGPLPTGLPSAIHTTGHTGSSVLRYRQCRGELRTVDAYFGTYMYAHIHTRTLTAFLPSLPQVYGVTTHTIPDPTPYTEVSVSIQTASLWSLNPQAVTGTFQSFPEREWLPNLHGNHLHITMRAYFQFINSSMCHYLQACNCQSS